MSNAQKLNLLRKTLQAAVGARGGDLPQAGVLGVPDFWQPSEPQAARNLAPRTLYATTSNQHPQGAGAAGASDPHAGMAHHSTGGATAVSRQQQATAAAASAAAQLAAREALRAQPMPAQHAWQQVPMYATTGQGPATHQMFTTHLLAPAGPGLPLPPIATAPPYALLSSLLNPSVRPPHDGAGYVPQSGHAPSNRLSGRGGATAGPGRTRGSSASIALNKEIMASSSLDQLLAIVRSHSHMFDFFNISTAVSRVPKLLDTTHISPHASAAPPGPLPGSYHAPHDVPDHADEAAAQAAAAAHGFRAGGCDAAHHLSPVAKELADRLCGLVLRHLPEFDGRGLANTAWAFAKLRYVPDASLPPALCRAAADRLDQFAPQNVSNLAWALVYMHYQDNALLAQLKQKACDQVYDMKPQELANVMWALASHEQLDDGTAHTLGKRAVSLAGVFKEQELSNVVWALGRAGVYDPALLDPLLASACAKLTHFMPQGVANMVWALGQLGHRDNALLAAVARHCPSSLSQYDAQALANLATGLAALGAECGGLMPAIANEAAQRAPRMTGQHLVAVLAACAKLGLRNDRLLAATHDMVLTRPSCLEPPALASLAWAITRLGPPSQVLIEALAAAIVAKADRFSSQALVAVTLAFAEAGPAGIPVLQAVAGRLPAVVASLAAPQCMAVSWALSQGGVQAPEVSACLIARVAQCAENSPPACESPGPAPAQQQHPAGDSQASRVAALVTSLVASAQGGGPPPDASLHPMLLAAARASMPDMDPAQLAASCWALAALGVLDVTTLAMYEASMEGYLTTGAGLVGPAEVTQVCAAHVAVATQLATRLGVPFTALPAQLMPTMQPALANAVYAAAAGGDTSTTPFAPLDASLDTLTAQLQSLSAGGSATTRRTTASSAAGSSSPFLPMIANSSSRVNVGNATNVLGALAAARDAVTGPNMLPQHARRQSGASGAVGPPALAGSPPSLASMSPETLARWVGMWSAGGLGNGVLGNGSASTTHTATASVSGESSIAGDGSAHASPPAGSPMHRTPPPPPMLLRMAADAPTAWGDEAETGRLSSHAAGGGAPRPARAAAASPEPRAAMVPVAAGMHGGDAWTDTSSALGAFMSSCRLGRHDSLEEAGGLWLPRDLLAAMPSTCGM